MIPQSHGLTLVNHSLAEELHDDDIQKGPTSLLPVVQIPRLTQKEIRDLTKHKNRKNNLRAYMEKMRLLRRKLRSQKYRKRRLDCVETEKTKVRVFQEFLEYRSSGLRMDDVRGIVIFKPRHFKSRNCDIDREMNCSETSSVSEVFSSETERPRRKSSAPQRLNVGSIITPRKHKSKPIAKEADNSDGTYEVEAVCDINLIHNQVFLQVKWENYSTKDNTWEPLESLKDCQALEEFLNEEIKGNENIIKEFCQNLLDEQKSVIDEYMKKPKSTLLQELNTFIPIEYKCNQLIYMLIKDQHGFYLVFKRKFRHQVILNYFHELDLAQKAAHKLIKRDIMKKENEIFTVSIENKVDFSIFDYSYFNYTRENIYPPDFNILNRSTQSRSTGCKCIDGKCSRESNCCPAMVREQFAYKSVNNKNRLRLRNTRMIYECNDSCVCDENCLNRVTQQARRFPFTIFKTNDGRGWGLKASCGISEGTYLMQYTGEVIDQEEALRRGKEYDEIGMSYLFDLDFNENADAIFTIDAARYGNLSRLINHSCDPNCRIWPVTTCNQNQALYKLCYFTTRYIKDGEELSIDYCGGVLPQELNKFENRDEVAGKNSSQHNIERRHRTTESCKCGTAKCKGFIFN